ncbi:MAG: hypothetical protein ACFFB3_16735 [Candidatus Hodarchaeota archaeon]
MNSALARSLFGVLLIPLIIPFCFSFPLVESKPEPAFYLSEPVAHLTTFSLKSAKQADNISIEDIADFYAGAEFDLIWNATASAPLAYNITRNATYVAINVSWSGDHIIYNESLQGILGNSYLYNCTAWNTNYTIVHSSVRVFIDNKTPIFANENTDYLIREYEQLTLTWNVTDDNPASYSIEYRPRPIVGEISWDLRIQAEWTGEMISYNITASTFVEGAHEFRCNATDAAGNISSRIYTVVIAGDIPEEVWGGIFGLKVGSEPLTYFLLFMGILFLVGMGIGGWMLLSPKISFRKSPGSDFYAFGRSLKQRINSEQLELSRAFISHEHLAEQQMADRMEKAGEKAKKTAETLKQTLEEADKRIIEFVALSKFRKAYGDALKGWGKIISGYTLKVERLAERGETFAVAQELERDIKLLERQGANEQEIKNYLKDPDRRLAEILEWGHYDILRIVFTSPIALELVNQHAEQGIVEGISKQSSWSKMKAFEHFQKKQQLETEFIERKSEIDELVGEVRHELEAFLSGYTHRIRMLWKENQYAEALAYAQGIVENGTDFIDQYESRFEDFVHTRLQASSGEIPTKFQDLPSRFEKARDVNLNKLKTLQHNYIVKTVENCAFHHLRKKSPVDYLDVQTNLSGIDEIQLATILTRLAKENEQLEFNEITHQLSIASPKCVICWTDIRQRQESQTCPYCKVRAHKDHWNEWIRQNGFCPKCKRPIKV